ncbi:hypothetical protein V8F20_010367 [Naviculisporaceae sp. PSN 640]
MATPQCHRPGLKAESYLLAQLDSTLGLPIALLSQALGLETHADLVYSFADHLASRAIERWPVDYLAPLPDVEPKSEQQPDGAYPRSFISPTHLITSPSVTYLVPSMTCLVPVPLRKHHCLHIPFLGWASGGASASPLESLQQLQASNGTLHAYPAALCCFVTFIDSNGTVHHYYALGGHGGVSNSSWGRGVEGTAVHNYYGRGNGPGGSRVISTSGPLFGPGVVHHHYEAGEGNGAARGHGVGSFDRGGHLRSESVNGNDAGRGGGSGGNRLDSRRPHRRGRMRNRNAPSAIAEEKR